MQQCGLARTRGASDADILAGLDLHTGIAEREHMVGLIAIARRNDADRALQRQKVFALA